MPPLPQPNSFGEYDRVACRTDRFHNGDALLLAMHGVLGEAGSVLAEVKKHQRDATSFESHRLAVLEELGDTLWYVASVARHAGLSLVQVARNMPMSALPTGRDGLDVLFSSLYDSDLAEEFEENPEYMDELASFGGQVGFLLSLPRDNLDSFAIRDQLALVLASLVRVSHISGLTISEVATFNLTKILRRWPTSEFREFDKDFEGDAPSYERIPELLDIQIKLVESPTGYFVYQSANGIILGDRITDNIVDQDYYRYHDVFHYAYAAVLGWSPVIRALLHVKRKYDPEIDRNQDGARAMILEEAVSAYVFSKAKHMGYFEDVETGGLSYDLLKAIESLVKGYEVEACPPWLWEEAILQGYSAFRFVKQHGGGIVTLDRRRRSLSAREL